MHQQRHLPMVRGDQDTPQFMTPTRTRGTKMRKMIRHYPQHRATATHSPTRSRHRGTASRDEGGNCKGNMPKGNQLAPLTFSPWSGAKHKLPPSLGNSSRPLSRGRPPYQANRLCAIQAQQARPPNVVPHSQTPPGGPNNQAPPNQQTQQGEQPAQGPQGGAATPQQQAPQQQPRLIPKGSSRSRSTSRSRPRQHKPKLKPPAVDGDTQQTTRRRSKRGRGSSGEASRSNSKAQRTTSKVGEHSNTPLLIKSKTTHSKPLNSKKSAIHKGDKNNKMINAEGERARAITMKVKEINAEETRRRRARFVQNSRSGGSTNPDQ